MKMMLILWYHGNNDRCSYDYENNNDEDDNGDDISHMIHYFMDSFQILMFFGCLQHLPNTLLHFFKFRVEITVHEIYYKARFIKIFRRFSKSYLFI